MVAAVSALGDYVAEVDAMRELARGLPEREPCLPAHRGPGWEAADVAESREAYSRDLLTLEQYEREVELVLRSRHYSGCLLYEPGGACTCGGDAAR